MTPLAGQGISLQLPTGWEGRIGLRSTGTGPAVAAASTLGPATVGSVDSRGAAPAVQAPGASSRPESLGAAQIRDDGRGGRLYPVTHVGNFALPPDRGDFGSGAVDVMGTSGVLLALVEYGAECVGTELFAAPRPVPRIAEFAPDTLQRRIPGQLGYQRFFTEAGRAFCLYVVVGSIRYAPSLLDAGRTVLAHTTIAPRGR